jgi:3-oxoacyl-[acyl-carrier protein] reductase
MSTEAAAEKIVVVTGGSMGIGLEIARRFVDDGASVYIVGRNRARLEAAAQSLGERAIALAGDVSVRADVERIAAAIGARHGRVDLLVNNAAALELIPVGMDLEQAEVIFDRVIGSGLKGAFLMSHALIPMLPSPGGRIVNIGSIVSQSGGSATGYSGYTPAKAGVHGLTLALARELGPRGITVNTIAPGFVQETGFTTVFEPERIKTIVSQIVLGRAGIGEDIANAVAWIASDQASYVTGVTLPVNGGWRFYS